MRAFGIRAATAIGSVAVAATVVTTLAHLHQGNITPAHRAGAVAAVHADPLTPELLHCQAIGVAAKDDAACEAAWADNRRRFFAPLIGVPSGAPRPDARPQR